MVCRLMAMGSLACAVGRPVGPGRAGALVQPPIFRIEENSVDIDAITVARMDVVCVST